MLQPNTFKNLFSINPRFTGTHVLKETGVRIVIPAKAGIQWGNRTQHLLDSAGSQPLAFAGMTVQVFSFN
jgi:hypothetical protein